MAEKSKKKKKKSKDYSSDSSDEDITGYVNKEVNRALKQVNQAMAQAKIARKAGRKAQKAAFRSASLGDDTEMYVDQDAEPVDEDKNYKSKKDKKGDKYYESHTGRASSWSESKGNNYTQYNMVYHNGTMINIQNAQNVQVGNNNLMVVTDQKYSRQRRTSPPRDTREEEKQKEEDERKDREIDARFKEVLDCPRPATVEDFTKACTHVTNWRRFLRNLDLHDAEIDHLYQDHYATGVKEVMIQGAILWKQKTARGATLGAFATILKKVKQFEAIEVLKVDYRQTTV